MGIIGVVYFEKMRDEDVFVFILLFIKSFGLRVRVISGEGEEIEYFVLGDV